MNWEAMPLALDAAQVIFSGSLDSRMPFFVAPASATTTLAIIAGQGNDHKRALLVYRRLSSRSP